MNTPQLFCDMDGVLADFDTGYRTMVGPYGGKDQDDVDWKKIKDAGEFFLLLPPMPDMDYLWSNIEHLNPIILTGVPTQASEEALSNKRAWVDKHIGRHVRMIGCLSAAKCLHAKPGDVLIDDWEKYKHLWVGAGGNWITHYNASATLGELENYFALLWRNHG